MIGRTGGITRAWGFYWIIMYARATYPRPDYLHSGDYSNSWKMVLSGCPGDTVTTYQLNAYLL